MVPNQINQISKIKDPIEQVIRQVHDIKEEIEIDLNDIPSKDIFDLDISY